MWSYCYFSWDLMMSGTHFYLPLPSNASMDICPDNKTTEYRVSLLHYYLAQQQGHGPSVFQGSVWQFRHTQTGYGLGRLFCSLARAAIPMVKTEAKALGKIALKSGRDLVTDVLEGKNVKARALEAANVAKGKAISQIKNQLKGQTGSG